MLTQEEHPLFLTAPSEVTQDLGDILLDQHSYSAHILLEKELKALLVEQGLVNRRVEPIIFGGDHSITLPILRTLKPVVGQPIALLHLDAHHDNWDEVFGERISHGTWVHRAIYDGLVDPETICQIGVRSPSNPKRSTDLANKGAMVVTAREAMKKDPAAVATATPALLRLPQQ
jgi:agmatinase